MNGNIYIEWNVLKCEDSLKWSYMVSSIQGPAMVQFWIMTIPSNELEFYILINSDEMEREPFSFRLKEFYGSLLFKLPGFDNYLCFRKVF